MGRVIGIDYGSKRVGLAVTDPLKIIASPLDTVHSKDVIEFLKNYMKTEEVEEIVVGMPKNLNNEDTNATPLVKAFINLLKKNFQGLKIILQDERFTSKMALDAMIAAGSSKKQRREKGNIDKVSASIILQSYLEQTK
ncbi:MAG: Holliday junction resolvase RuvX [bacterium]|nr:Holliday junction resolvase RuvX [bacterium]